MKIRALGPLSGASGDREKGEVFTVAKDYGEGLISRGYAEEVVEAVAAPSKPGKADLAKE
ncbi:hypothetical protein [Pseudomonas cichorii]|uniref:Uncharacterized protein n=1 Tax=Pseudomonas cichorii TaxID=36746 RepID=A0ABQ1DII6_PSECI|nr:hypothetical protein [Pseudomonas cichorii]AHF68690.1 hypothetical protein PCH70_35370 [Pseudomonas cichorii JBC1]QVE15688.1 hypothetical protein KGD89_17575 [Pseudomonas cichorii]GFM90795.1 hypothetical protein PSCICP_07670 [Pseudomonas cichorii]SDN33317.1 hypothetical protein SAMN05216599_101653 [Pseudomonas cichorii]